MNPLNNLQMLKERSDRDQIPFVEDEILDFLSFYLKDEQYSCIVEVGTGYGYSATFFYNLLRPEKLITIESSTERASVARANLNPQIELIEGDATEVLESLVQHIDLLFIDAGKSHYLDYFLAAKDKLRDGSLIVADNVFARGLTYSKNIKRRNKTIQNHMREFISYMQTHYQAYVLPIGDGLLLARYYE